MYVTWIPRGNGGFPIQSFRVEYKKLKKVGDWILATSAIPPSRLSVEITGLEKGRGSGCCPPWSASCRPPLRGQSELWRLCSLLVLHPPSCSHWMLLVVFPLPYKSFLLHLSIEVLNYPLWGSFLKKMGVLVSLGTCIWGLPGRPCSGCAGVGGSEVSPSSWVQVSLSHQAPPTSSVSGL